MHIPLACWLPLSSSPLYASGSADEVAALLSPRGPERTPHTPNLGSTLTCKTEIHLGTRTSAARIVARPRPRCSNRWKTSLLARRALEAATVRRPAAAAGSRRHGHNSHDATSTATSQYLPPTPHPCSVSRDGLLIAGSSRVIIPAATRPSILGPTWPSLVDLIGVYQSTDNVPSLTDKGNFWSANSGRRETSSSPFCMVDCVT
jgi:hypothetical protein